MLSSQTWYLSKAETGCLPDKWREVASLLCFSADSALRSNALRNASFARRSLLGSQLSIAETVQYRRAPD
jgi:hypothetical protein